MSLTDSFGRKINYLRLSVTDRCNMRCTYCMPVEGLNLLGRNEVLSYEELLMVAGAAVATGIEKIRVTGGEPLVRKGIIPFLERLAAVPGLRQLVLTTNGLALAEMAEPLRNAGVQRLNISLDSLRAGTLASITRGADLKRVLAGIEAAGKAGFPLKINMVVMSGINDAEILDFVALTLNRPITVRFIEYMPATRPEGWQELVVPGESILERIGSRYGFTSLQCDGMAGPARMFRVSGAAGEFGIITPITGHFCAGCNRIRVTSRGLARGCLFSDHGLDLKPYLATGDSQALAAALRAVVAEKPVHHSLSEESCRYTPFTMSSIGG